MNIKNKARVWVRSIMRKLLLISLFSLPTISHAALFGASSYEECVNDGKVGRTNFEMRALINKCRKDFPMLPKLAKKKEANLVCRDTDGKTVNYVEVKSNTVKMSELKNILLNKTSHNKDELTFKGNATDKDTSEDVTMYGIIYLTSGSGNIKVEYKNKSKADVEYFFSCYEN